MYEDLIQKLREDVELHKSIYQTSTVNEHFVGAMEEAADAIEELQEDNAELNGTISNLIEQIAELSKPKWIPVTERLPGEDGMYLVHGIWSASGKKVTDTCEFYVHDGYFRAAWNFNATHWMPLPTPPKEE